MDLARTSTYLVDIEVLDGVVKHSVQQVQEFDDLNTEMVIIIIITDRCYITFFPALELTRSFSFSFFLIFFKDMLSFNAAIFDRTRTWTAGSLTCVCGLVACEYTWETSVYTLIRRTFVESALLTLEKSPGGRKA